MKQQNLVKILSTNRFEDHRGFFTETYNSKEFKNLGITDHFVQDNQSYSKYNQTLRGLHYQAPPYAQAKLVRCVRGAIFDVGVDIRRGSPTYGQWAGYDLTAENGLQLYVPVGFAHGFVTLEKNTEVVYKCSNYYEPQLEGAIRWDSCGINWRSLVDPILSEKDATAPVLADFNSPFIYGENS